ncbi:diguanylate cyclase [Clostridium bowmanii]|uniref:diguanylate cyclase n=1 Tax=Clostridium bowmanii TaxID=132925 RepID=UPI001C0B0081|nr:diguanylate cyclase [Clostridium bowmanii]MBU3189410.1 diguanylate cyclase [Clostridium bowmanii]MCA1074024.1 diguanylate cyclase [Clostridium bowmanii]
MMLKKQKPVIITLSIIILAALLSVIFTLNRLSSSDTSSNINSQKGVLELSDWDFNKDGYTSLGGQWEFYWQQLLSPEDLSNSAPLPSYIEMPMEWNKYNKNYSSNGYATYRLTIKLNEKYKNTLLGISVPPMLSSYKLWVNGNLFLSNGIVGTSGSSETPATNPITNYFMNSNNSVQLILQVSNHNFRNGGTWDKLYLGTQSQMANKRESSIALEIFYFGILLIMGLYHLWLYSFRTNDNSKFYFGALCITLSLRALIVGNKYILTMYNNLSYGWTLKLEYMTFYAGVYFMLSYIYLIFKNDCSTIVRKSCKLLCFLFILITIFISPLLASKFLLFFQIFTLLIIIYTTFVILKACLTKKRGTFIMAIGCLVPIGISGITVLKYLGLNHSNDYSLSGFFLLILLNAFILAMNESKSYKKVENLSKEKEKYMLAEKLTAITFLLNSSLNLEEVLDKLLKSLKELVPYDSASFFMEENNHFNVMAANGFKDIDSIYKISINKEDDLLFKKIYETNTALLISNVKNNPHFKHHIELTTLESWMGIPIIFKDKIIGILTLDSTQKDIYTQYHIDIAMYFACHAGMAIENAKLHGKTKKLATIDPLTNLYNRRSFFELANIDFEKSKVLAQPISGIMMDIDDFKKINDTLGHHTGDLVLNRLSKVCLETLGKNHIFGRYGGEEFIALLPSTSIEDVAIIGEKLRSAVENNPIIIRKSDLIPVTISVGTASITPTIQDLNYLFGEADKALYQAKSLGKNQVISINLDS